MKQHYLLPATLILVFLFAPIGSALFTSPSTLKGTLLDDTKAFFIGKTSIQGTCAGYPMNSLTDSPLVQEMEGFPLLGETTIAHLDSVIVAEDINITAADSLGDLIEQYYDHLTEYTDVDIITEEGFFLLGIQDGNIMISDDLPYAVSTIMTLDILQDTPARFFVAGTNQPLHMSCTAGISVLITLSETSSIHVRDSNGMIRWRGRSPNDYLLIQDTSFTVVQHPALCLLPLPTNLTETPLTFTITPSETKDVLLAQLIETVSGAVETNLHDGASADFLPNLNTLGNLIQTASYVSNGAVVFLQTNDTVIIDESTQQFSSVGFVRFNTLEITNAAALRGPTVQADSTLTFLGDHFYTPQAKQSQQGIRFPFELVIIWIVALIVFIYIRFFLRPPVDTVKDNWIKRYAFFIHIAALIITFLLLDVEVYFLFGISAISALFLQGFSMTTGMFFAIEVIIWILGFFILAIPVQLLTYSILRLRGIGRGGNGLWKSIGDLSIWIFCGFYLLLFLNIIFSVIDFSSIFPVR